MADHSHEIGLANLPFTRRGRKAAADASTRRRGTRATTEGGSDSHERSASPPGSPPSPAPNLPGPSNQVPHVAPPQQQPHPPPTFQSAIMGIAQPAPHPHTQLEMSQERWDRMAVLFQNMRDHARTFEFPPPSVAALESVLIRLYLESPMGGGTCTTTLWMRFQVVLLCACRCDERRLSSVRYTLAKSNQCLAGHRACIPPLTLVAS